MVSIEIRVSLALFIRDIQPPIRQSQTACFPIDRIQEYLSLSLIHPVSTAIYDDDDESYLLTTEKWFHLKFMSCDNKRRFDVENFDFYPMNYTLNNK